MIDEIIFNSIGVDATAAGITAALGVEAPHGSAEPAKAVLQLVNDAFGDKGCDRVLMYNPDAVAMWLYQKYTEKFLPVQKNIQLTLPLCTVMPSVTPVCFASMYTGVKPEVHGIRRYEKPVLTVDTVFDALIRAGKKPAIVSTEGDSISKIFLERDMDYYIYPTVEECNACALKLIEEDRYDLIVLYNGDYDSTMHRNAPEGEASLAVLEKNAAVFDTLCKAVDTHWADHRTMVVYAPDHGCHEIDGGLGSHGLDMPEDLNILHFYSVRGKR